ncbi:hypothetical protein PPSIR1_16050 [Plesiocystis pacifica SIR-1]|uniref:Uncharacterized protein n=1 Tax=Plesiocystis pacifica SIR-1 TaxID=391625 RepID=A6GAT8_9BACT|nr:hypothetical protein [Plesiocystis pacifica]EDM77029.1 hypothetical protein PPSIR1_16050 [Plesiocystis pacifica SIR-1]
MISLPRNVALIGVLGLLIAVIASVWAGGERTRAVAVGAMAEDALVELGLLAGVRDDAGALQREEPMAVEVIQDGGPMWVREVVEEAVGEDPAFAVGNSPHLMRVEVVDGRGGVALALHLWRAGWDLRVPEPRRIRVAPWAAVLGAVLGAFAGVFTRRGSVALLCAGLLAQIALGLAPISTAVFPPQTLVEAWGSSPLARRIVELAQTMTTTHQAIAAAFVALCLVLVAFDHRSSKEREDALDLGSAGLVAIASTVGVVAWIEAASRSSLLASLHHGAGWVTFLGLGMLAVPVVYLARQRQQEERDERGILSGTSPVAEAPVAEVPEEAADERAEEQTPAPERSEAASEADPAEDATEDA